MNVGVRVNITMGLEEFGSEDVDWIYLAGHGQVVASCEYLNEPSGY